MIVLGVIVGVFVVLACYDLLSSRSALISATSTSSAVSSAAARATPAATASAARPSPSPASASAAASPSATASPSASLDSAQALSVASAAAFGPDGTSDGDNAVNAWRVIGGGAGQPWHSSWYTTPEFGNLQSGTGILLDMGKIVTVNRVRLVLGDSVGADIQLRIGDSATPPDLSAAASATDVGGTVKLRVTSPVSGRYVLVWFTRLPPNSQGTYQIDVYSATVYGIEGT